MDAEDLLCSLCLDFFTPPVCITRCGHSFCVQSLTRMPAPTWQCPECRTDQNERPAGLTRNFFLERTVEKFKDSRKDNCSVHNLRKKLRKYYTV